jgi:hypothetical protein
MKELVDTKNGDVNLETETLPQQQQWRILFCGL